MKASYQRYVSQQLKYLLNSIYAMLKKILIFVFVIQVVLV